MGVERIGRGSSERCSSSRVVVSVFTTVMSCMERLEDAASSVIPTSPGRKAPRINSTERRAEPSDPYKLALTY